MEDLSSFCRTSGRLQSGSGIVLRSVCLSIVFSWAHGTSWWCVSGHCLLTQRMEWKLIVETNPKWTGPRGHGHEWEKTLAVDQGVICRGFGGSTQSFVLFENVLVNYKC